MSLTYPEDRSYHSEHLWAKAEPDGTMLVGITDYAQDQLGGVIFVDLPTVGEHFKQGVSCASIESVKITSDAIIPVSGEIKNHIILWLILGLFYFFYRISFFF